MTHDEVTALMTACCNLCTNKPVKHGRWEIGKGAVVCSECGKMYVSNIHYQTPLMHYCPNCGARMDEVEE